MRTVAIVFRGCVVDVTVQPDGRVEYWTRSAMLLTCGEAGRTEMRRLAGL